MGKRKGEPPFDPPIHDDLAREPTLAEIRRLDGILGTMVGEILGYEPHDGRVQTAASSATDEQGGKDGVGRARAKRPKGRK